MTLMLEVVVNGRDTGLLATFHLRGHALFATARDLAALGLRAPPVEGDIALAAMPGLRTRLDQRSQTLYIDAQMAALARQYLDATAEAGASNLPTQTGLGGVLNYAVADNQVVGGGHGLRQAGGGVADLRVFSAWGLIDASADASAPAGGDAPGFQRLDTTYSYADAATLRRYLVGDVITDGFTWSRPLRLAGGEISTDFMLRPDLVTFPVPSIAGAVAVPSSVEVMVNGVRMFARDIAPGPFEIAQLPVVNGSGDVNLTVRDASGTQRQQNLPIYANTALLAQGLLAYSIAAGVVRRYYGTAQDSYGSPAVLASVRRGMLDWLTLEAHAEASGADPSEGVRDAGGMGGLGLDLTLGQIGGVAVNVAGSQYGKGVGAQFGGAWQRTGPLFSVHAGVEHATARFADIAAVNGDPLPQWQINAGFGASLGSYGSFGVSYAAIRRPQVTLRGPTTQPDQGGGGLGGGGLGGGGLGPATLLPEATHASLLTASYSRTLLNGQAAFYVTGFHDFADTHASGLVLGLSVALGPRASVGAALQGGQGGIGATLQAQQATPTIGDWGGRALYNSGPIERELAVGETRAPFGLFDLGADRSGDQTTLRATAQGAIAVADGAVFATNTINDSFAVVDTAGAPGITVLEENRPIGQTGPGGRLLLTDLRSFDANRIGIDAADVPADAAVGQTERMVRPQDRVGVVVRFPIKASHAALVTLVTASGAALPVGSVTIGRAIRAELGFDGQVYLTGLTAHYRVRIRRPDGGVCEARFAYQPRRHWQPRIGPAICQAVAP